MKPGSPYQTVLEILWLWRFRRTGEAEFRSQHHSQKRKVGMCKCIARGYDMCPAGHGCIVFEGCNAIIESIRVGKVLWNGVRIYNLSQFETISQLFICRLNDWYSPYLFEFADISVGVTEMLFPFVPFSYLSVSIRRPVTATYRCSETKRRRSSKMFRIIW